MLWCVQVIDAELINALKAEELFTRDKDYIVPGLGDAGDRLYGPPTKRNGHES